MTPESTRIDELVRRVVAEMNGHAAGGGAAPVDGTNGAGRVARAEPARGGPHHPERPYRHTSRLITLADVEGRLDGRTALAVPPGAVLTPLALDYLRDRAIEVEYQAAPSRPAPGPVWGYGQESANAMVEAVIGSLHRDGLVLRPAMAPGGGDLVPAIHAAAAEVRGGACCGIVLFGDDAALIACLANKWPGIRAAIGWTVATTARATMALGANLLAVEPAGKPFYELRQIVRTFCSAGRVCDDGRGCPRVVCPEGLDRIISRWEGDHAHR